MRRLLSLGPLPLCPILVTARNVLNAPELGVEIAAALHRFYPDQFQLERMNVLLANKQVLQELAAGEDPEYISEGWRPALKVFLEKRQAALIYPDR